MTLAPCEVVRATGSRLAVWQQQQAAVGEESLTDWLLFELSSQLEMLRYVKFSRHKEARQTGADWEWWIRFTNGCFGFRVQAKRVQTIDDNYARLAYSNQHGLQIEMLRKDARKRNLPAMYMLYSPDSCGANPLCDRGVPVGDSGAFLASATRLYAKFIENGRRLVSAKDLVSQANPLSCLFCCPLMRSNDARGWHGHMTRYFAEEFGGEASGELGFRAELPFYARLVLSRDLQADAVQSQPQHDLPRVGGIVVLDMTGR